MYDYTEFNKLVVALTERGCDLIVREIYDGKQCCVADEQQWDFVIHCASYGHELGLLEVYGMEYLEDNDVEGNLTCEDVLERLDNPNFCKENEDGDVIESLVQILCFK